MQPRTDFLRLSPFLRPYPRKQLSPGFMRSLTRPGTSTPCFIGKPCLSWPPLTLKTYPLKSCTAPISIKSLQGEHIASKEQSPPRSLMTGPWMFHALSLRDHCAIRGKVTRCARNSKGRDGPPRVLHPELLERAVCHRRLACRRPHRNVKATRTMVETQSNLQRSSTRIGRELTAWTHHQFQPSFDTPSGGMLC